MQYFRVIQFWIAVLLLAACTSNPPTPQLDVSALSTQAVATIYADLTKSVPPTVTASPTSTATATRPATLTPTPTSDIPATATPKPAFPPGSTAKPRAVDGMRMVYIPPGSFQMGSKAYADEFPIHTVSLDAFWMDEHEVTNVMYKRCVEVGACEAPTNTAFYTAPSYARYPVIFVDWERARVYCAWTGGRLPSEAEWEYAARGGLEGKRYPWGNDGPLVDVRGVKEGAHYNHSTDFPVAVKTFQPNAYGLYDVAGNVWEWVNDWYGPYSSQAVTNPQGPETGTQRVMRGGSWINFDFILLVTSRAGDSPRWASDEIGFRCVRTATAAGQP